MKVILGKLARTLSAGVFLLATSCAFASDGLPPVQVSGKAEFISGGIGSDESRAIKGASKNWPLVMEFSEKEGSRNVYASEVKIRATDAKGQIVMQSDSVGPFLLLRLEPGDYTVEATLEGKPMSKKATVVPGKSSRLIFYWSSGSSAAR
jgi:hypothetical protein